MYNLKILIFFKITITKIIKKLITDKFNKKIHFAAAPTHPHTIVNEGGWMRSSLPCPLFHRLMGVELYNISYGFSLPKTLFGVWTILDFMEFFLVFSPKTLKSF